MRETSRWLRRMTSRSAVQIAREADQRAAVVVAVAIEQPVERVLHRLLHRLRSRTTTTVASTRDDPVARIVVVRRREYPDSRRIAK